MMNGVTRVLAMGLLLATLCGCHSTYIKVNPENKRSPQFAYRHDELALLTLAADDIMSLEKKKRYNQIFDRFASKELKTTLGQRRFMKVTNCVEMFLGGLVDYDNRNLGFSRVVEKGKTYDYIVRETDREDGSINEKLVFVFDGAEFKLYGISWESDRRDFGACIKDARKAISKEAKVPVGQELPGPEDAGENNPEEKKPD